MAVKSPCVFIYHTQTIHTTFNIHTNHTIIPHTQTTHTRSQPLPHNDNADRSSPLNMQQTKHSRDACCVSNTTSQRSKHRTYRIIQFCFISQDVYSWLVQLVKNTPSDAGIACRLGGSISTSSEHRNTHSQNQPDVQLRLTGKSTCACSPPRHSPPCPHSSHTKQAACTPAGAGAMASPTKHPKPIAHTPTEAGAAAAATVTGTSAVAAVSSRLTSHSFRETSVS
jgi:hypothetical protein